MTAGEVSKIPVQASMLRVGDVGRTVESLTYRDKNKTTKPTASGTRNEDGTITWRRKRQRYTIDSLYVHRNGNILINNGIYLRADTDIFFVYED